MATVTSRLFSLGPLAPLIKTCHYKDVFVLVFFLIVAEGLQSSSLGCGLPEVV